MKTLVKFLIGFFAGLIILLIGVNMGGYEIIESLDPSKIIITQNDEKEYTYTFDQVSKGIDLNVCNAQINFYRHGDQDVKIKVTNASDLFDVYETNEYIYIKQEFDLFNNQAKIDIGLPNSLRFDEVNVKAFIYCEINDLRIDELKVDNKCGKLVINQCITDELSLQTRASVVEVNHLECKDFIALDTIGSQIQLYSLQEYNYDLNTQLSKVVLFNQEFLINEDQEIDHQVKQDLKIESLLSDIELKGEK